MSPKKTVRISPDEPDIIESQLVEDVDLSPTVGNTNPISNVDSTEYGVAPTSPSFSNIIGPPARGAGGEIVKLGDIDSYVSKPADYPHTPARLLILLTGGNGIRIETNQLFADRFAALGFLVVMPDQFHGNAMPHIIFDDPTLKTTYVSRLFGRIGDLAKGFKIDRWFAFHTAEHAAPAIIEAISHAIELYPNTVEQQDGETVVPCLGVLIGAKNAAYVAGNLEQQRLRYETFIQKSDPDSGASGPSQPLFQIRKLALATPSLLVTSNLTTLATGSAIHIVGRFGDAILEDCPAPQADPYARPSDPDPEAGTGTDAAEREANESLPAFVDLRARGISVQVNMFDRHLPDAFILNPSAEQLTEADREEVRIRSEEAVNQIASFLRAP